jgi:nucleoside-diphosphate-sugar epimerase
MPDIGSGLVVLGEREEALGQAWHLPSPETVTTREEFVRMIFEEVKNKPARVQAAPKVLLRALDIFNPPLRKTIETLYEFEEPFVVDHSKFEPALGDHVTPLEEAIRDTVRWYRTRRPARRRSPGRLEMEGSEVDLCLRRF